MHISCPHCHNRIELVEIAPREAVSCPSCGSAFRLDAQSTITITPSDGQTLGRFQLIDTVGHGAFGTVYKARDPLLDRVVAIKVPRAGSLAGPQELDRFLREARSVAQLRHPSIVPIHEVGQVAGVPYLVSELVQGVTLADWLTARRPSPHDAAELVAAVADALQSAHEKGVVHRDVKPSNVMIGDNAVPYVMDFGLAKRDATEITMTMEGQILGTPAYMSPEQARGEAHRVDGRSDVYSLGVVLYQLLTGELPFRGVSRMLLHQVLHEEPRPPRTLNDRIPSDLQTIALKAMAKEPSQRYPSAADLAADLRRFLKGEPILARATGSAEKLWRWCKRNPVIAGLTAAVAATLLAGIAISSYFAIRANNSAHQASREKLIAEQNAKEAGARADGERREKQLARRNLYVAHMYSARTAWETSDIGRALGLLNLYLKPAEGETDLRGFEWHYLHRLCNLDLHTLDLDKRCWSVAVSSDLRLTAAIVPEGDIEGTIISVIDTLTGHDVLKLSKNGKAVQFSAVAFSQDAERIAALEQSTHSVTLWDVRTGKEILTTGSGVDRQVGRSGKSCTLAFSPDGQFVASAEWCNLGNVRPDGTSFYGGELIVWDSTTGMPLMRLKGEEAGELLQALAFSSDSKLLAISSNVAVKVWELATQRKTLTIESQCRNTFGEHSVAFSADGRSIACAEDDGVVGVWDAQTGRKTLTLRGHAARSVTFDSDGKRIGSGGESTVRVWDATSGKELLTLRGHTSIVTNVVFGSDGWRLASIDQAGVVKLWDSATSQESYSLHGHSADVSCVAFSPDGKLLASGGHDQTVKIWDVATRRLIRTLDGHPGWVRGIAFDSNGDRLAAVGDVGGFGEPGFVKLWNVRAGQELATLTGHKEMVVLAAFSPNGLRLATLDRWGTIYVWDLDARKTVWERQIERGRAGPRCVAFSEDSQCIAFDNYKQVQVWDIIRGTEVLNLEGHASLVTSIVYSPDGRHIVSGGEDATIRFWDSVSGKSVRTYRAFTDGVDRLVFIARGGRLVSSYGQTVKLWDTVTGQEVFTLNRPFIGPGFAVNPDGSLIAFPADNRVEIVEGTPLTLEDRIHREANGLVRYLFGKGLARDGVLGAVRDDAKVSEPVRRKALALAEDWQPDVNAQELNNAIWATVRRSDATPDQYKEALQQAEMICRLDRENGSFVNTLGVARYRAGQFQEALDTLLRADKVNGGIPADLAFLAMAQHQLGQREQARATLARLRQAIEKSNRATDEETRLFVREAEALIGEPPIDSKESKGPDN